MTSALSLGIHDPGVFDSSHLLIQLSFLNNFLCCRQRGPVPSPGDAALELHRLYAQFHDCISGAVRGVDRVHVGLHVRRQQGLCAFFPRHCRHRKPCGSQPLPRSVAVQLRRLQPVRGHQWGRRDKQTHWGTKTTSSNCSNFPFQAFRRISRFKLFCKKIILRGFIFLKDKIIECFRKGLSLERGEAALCRKVSRNSLCLLHIYCSAHRAAWSC